MRSVAAHRIAKCRDSRRARPSVGSHHLNGRDVSSLRAGTLQDDVFGITVGLPAPITFDLAVEEVALATGRQDLDTETLDFDVANVTGFPVPLEGVDPALC